MTRSIRVRSSHFSYPVYFCRSGAIGKLITRHCKDASRVLFLVDNRVSRFHAVQLKKLSTGLSCPSAFISVPGGEKAKSWSSLGAITERVLKARPDRNTMIIAIGGGATTDVVGLAAALALRGLSWGVVPTTLLGMLDAAIGGKTAVNASFGKNLLGVFWPPAFVAIDPSFCATEPKSQLRAALAEAVKCYAIGGRPSIGTIEMAYESPSPANLFPAIVASASLKAKIVSLDEREAGKRAFLNFGHTIGHALERSLSFRRISHGRAVAAGIIGALHLSRPYLVRPDRSLDRVEALARRIASEGPRVLVDSGSVMKHMSSDKKRAGQRLRFVVLAGHGRPLLVEVARGSQLRAAVVRSILALNDSHYAKDSDM